MGLNLGNEWKEKRKRNKDTHSCSENDHPGINTWFRENDNWNLISYNKCRFGSGSEGYGFERRKLLILKKLTW